MLALRAVAVEVVGAMRSVAVLVGTTAELVHALRLIGAGRGHGPHDLLPVVIHETAE